MDFSGNEMFIIQKQMTEELQNERKIKFKCLNLEASVGICFFKELKDPEHERTNTHRIPIQSKNVTAPSLVSPSVHYSEAATVKSKIIRQDLCAWGAIFKMRQK